MSGLPVKLPPPDELVKLPVTTLATLILKHIGRVASERYVGRAGTITAERRKHWGDHVTYAGGHPPTPPRVDRYLHMEAISAAFDWLYIGGLICKVPDYSENDDDMFTITERGDRFLKRGDDALRYHGAEQLLSFELHRLIDARVRELFLLGETESAVLVAMKEVEIHMREASGLTNGLVGVQLATAAFKPGGGPLTDRGAEPSEQEGTMALFRGAMGTLRNAVAHRRVDYDDPVEAVEVILFADLLLRMIDRAKDARA